MDPLVYLLGGAGLVQTGTIVWLVVQLIRLGDRYHEEKDRARDAEHRVQQCQAQYQTTAREFAEHVERARKVEKDLRGDLDALEEDLRTTARPGDIKRRLERLSKARQADAPAPGPDDNSDPVVPPGATGPKPR